MTVHSIDPVRQSAPSSSDGRLACIVIPGYSTTSLSAAMAARAPAFSDADYALYRDLRAEHCRAADIEVWVWGLVPNHVHLILVPSDADGLGPGELAPVHRRLCQLSAAPKSPASSL